jgi:hypothetical protein
MVAVIDQDPPKQDTTHCPKVDAVVGKECLFKKRPVSQVIKLERIKAKVSADCSRLNA